MATTPARASSTSCPSTRRSSTRPAPSGCATSRACWPSSTLPTPERGTVTPTPLHTFEGLQIEWAGVPCSENRFWFVIRVEEYVIATVEARTREEDQVRLWP